LAAEKLAIIREEEQSAAAKILGVKEVVYLRHPDLGLGYTPQFRKELLRLILTYRPEIIVTCDPYSMKYSSNPDHRVTGRAVLDAVWPFALAPNTYRDLLAEGLRLHKVREVWLWASEKTNFRSDISATFDLKIAAVKCHPSQIGVMPPGWEERTRERAMQAAKGEKFELAEPFHRIEVLQRL
jgi:LmbE family N-acetylglucosaminyl deacetylase